MTSLRFAVKRLFVTPWFALFWILIPGVPLFLYRHRFSERTRKTVSYLLILLFFAVYAFRMASPGNTIVVFRPGDGLIKEMGTRTPRG